MKTWLTIFLFSISLYCPAQYYESSGYLSSNYINGAARGYYPGTTSWNFRGNVFHFYGKDICMSCNMDLFFYKSSKTGHATNIAFPYNMYGTTNNVTGFEDQHENTYMQWETDYIGNMGGGLYNITGGYNSTLFKYDHNVLRWIIDVEQTNTLYADMDDNIYMQYNDRIRKYDSTGVLVDSMLFTPQTQPGSMDSLGYFYRYRNDSLTKFDFSNNTVWSLYLPGSAVNYAMQGPVIFTSNATTINLVSLNGTITSYPNAAGAACYQYDVDGNYYQGPSKKYNINTGLVYNDTTVHFSSYIMDRTGRFYAYDYRDFSRVYNNAVTFNLPPDVFRIIGPIDNVYWGEWFTWYQVFNTDHVNKNINIGLTNYSLSGFCSGSPATSSVEFTVDNYPPSLSYLGFNVELSDSSGSFATPLLLGVTTTNKLKFVCPPGIIAGYNYRVRVTPNLQGYTVTNNISAPSRVRTAPTAILNFTNGVYLTPSYYGIGFCDSIFLSAQTSSNSPTYLWENVFYNGNNTFLTTPLGSTSSLYLKQTQDFTRLTVTDTNGCYNTADVEFSKLYNNTNSIINWDTINSNYYHTFSLASRFTYYTDTIWGNNVYGSAGGYYFNVDSAAPGWNYFYAAFPQQNIIGTPLCGNDTLVDSVYVYGYAAATVVSTGNTQLCIGDTATALITLFGTPPFTFYMRENNVRTGPYNTTQSQYIFKRKNTTASTFNLTIDSLADANGSHFSKFNGVASYTFTNTAIPGITATGSTTFCLGDSVRLSRTSTVPNYTYTWMRNGNIIPGATPVYYAKQAGNYYLAVNNNGCVKNSFSINVSVPCAPPVGGSNDKLADEYSADADMTDATADPTITLTADRSQILIACPAEFNLQSIALYDMSGRLVDKLNGNNKSTTEFIYTLPTLSNGVYTMQVLCNNKYLNKKIAVSNGR